MSLRGYLWPLQSCTISVAAQWIEQPFRTERLQPGSPQPDCHLMPLQACHLWSQGAECWTGTKLARHNGPADRVSLPLPSMAKALSLPRSIVPHRLLKLLSPLHMSSFACALPAIHIRYHLPWKSCCWTWHSPAALCKTKPRRCFDLSRYSDVSRVIPNVHQLYVSRQAPLVNKDTVTYFSLCCRQEEGGPKHDGVPDK